MKTSPKNSRIFMGSPVLKSEGVEHLTHARIGLAFIAEAERALVLRDEKALERVTTILLRKRMPRELRELGQYYLGMCLLRQGLLSDSVQQLNSVTETGPPVYRARALVALAGARELLGDRTGAKETYDDALKASRDVDVRAYWQARKNKAVLASSDGDHAGALRTLRNLAPVARFAAKAYPMIAYEQLNGIAIELAFNNENSEAIAIAESMEWWPLLGLYPEFEHTRQTLLRLRGSRSRLFLPRDTHMGTIDGMAASVEQIKPTPGSVLPFIRPKQQIEAGTECTIIIDGIPLFDGQLDDKNAERLVRLVGTF